MKAWLTLCWVLALSGCAAERELRLGWSTEEPAASWSKLLRDSLDNSFSVAVSQHPDYAALQQGLLSGEIDLAILAQSRQPPADLTALAYLYPSILHVLARGCPRADSLPALLADASVYPGPRDSAGYRLLMDLSDAELIPPMHSLNILASPFGAEPDVLLVFGGILSADALSRLGEYCLVSLTGPGDHNGSAWVDAITLRFPHLQSFVLPSGFYPPLSSTAVVTLAVPSLLVAGSHLSEDAAYQVSRLIETERARWQPAFPLQRIAAETADWPRQINLPLHPGAMRFYNRDEPSFVERYAELLAFALTLIAALTSAAVAMLRFRRQAKKDRLDEYFDKLMHLRDGQKTDAAQRVRQLQAQVTELVVAERVAADASLVAFYALSNQVLQELESP